MQLSTCRAAFNAEITGEQSRPILRAALIASPVDRSVRWQRTHTPRAPRPETCRFATNCNPIQASSDTTQHRGCSMERAAAVNARWSCAKHSTLGATFNARINRRAKTADMRKSRMRDELIASPVE